MDPFIIIIIVFLVAILGIAVWAGAAPCTMCKQDEVDGTKPWYSFLCFEGDEFDAGEAECDWAPAVTNDTGGGTDPGDGTTPGAGTTPGGGTTGGDGGKIGCMNVSKFNYDPDAKVAGPCEDVVEGCIDDTKLGYNSSANTAADPDVCGATIVTGCMTPGYLEYSSAANKADNSCATFTGGTVDIKLLNTEDPLACPYAGEAFVCADLVACKETLDEGQEVSYLDMRENVCNPVETAERRAAALESGDVPFGWSDQVDQYWADDQPYTANGRSALDDFNAKIGLYHATIAIRDAAANAYTAALAWQQQLYDQAWIQMPLGMYNMTPVLNTGIAFGLATEAADRAYAPAETSFEVVTAMYNNRHKKCYDGYCDRRVMCQYKDDDLTNPEAALIESSNMKSRTACEGTWVPDPVINN